MNTQGGCQNKNCIFRYFGALLSSLFLSSLLTPPANLTFSDSDPTAVSTATGKNSKHEGQPPEKLPEARVGPTTRLGKRLRSSGKIVVVGNRHKTRGRGRGCLTQPGTHGYGQGSGGLAPPRPDRGSIRALGVIWLGLHLPLPQLLVVGEALLALVEGVGAGGRRGLPETQINDLHCRTAGRALLWGSTLSLTLTHTHT